MSHTSRKVFSGGASAAMVVMMCPPDARQSGPAHNACATSPQVTAGATRSCNSDRAGRAGAEGPQFPPRRQGAASLMPLEARSPTNDRGFDGSRAERRDHLLGRGDAAAVGAVGGREVLAGTR